MCSTSQSVTYARSVTEPQAEDIAPIRDEMALIIYTDEEIAAAIKFMTLAPHATDPDRIKELMVVCLYIDIKSFSNLKFKI